MALVDIPRAPRIEQLTYPVAWSAADGGLVTLRGVHDLSTRAMLAETLARAVEVEEGDLTIDLSAVEFMDGCVVAVLIRARDYLRDRGRRLILRDPSPAAARLLDLCAAFDSAVL